MASGHQKGFFSISELSQCCLFIDWFPIWINAERIFIFPGMILSRTLRAMAPAATREAVSLADERPPPR